MVRRWDLRVARSGGGRFAEEIWLPTSVYTYLTSIHNLMRRIAHEYGIQHGQGTIDNNIAYARSWAPPFFEGLKTYPRHKSLLSHRLHNHIKQLEILHGIFDRDFRLTLVENTVIEILVLEGIGVLVSWPDDLLGVIAVRSSTLDLGGDGKALDEWSAG